jgi:hypothetical protein
MCDLFRTQVSVHSVFEIIIYPIVPHTHTQTHTPTKSGNITVKTSYSKNNWENYLEQLFYKCRQENNMGWIYLYMNFSTIYLPWSL